MTIEIQIMANAKVVVFVAESNKARSLEQLHEITNQHRWQIVSRIEKATLIEELIKADRGEVWDAFLTARKRGYFSRTISDPVNEIIIYPSHQR